MKNRMAVSSIPIAGRVGISGDRSSEPYFGRDDKSRTQRPASRDAGELTTATRETADNRATGRDFCEKTDKLAWTPPVQRHRSAMEVDPWGRRVTLARHPTMFFALGLICIAVGVRFTVTHPEVIYQFGPLGLTYYHLLFLAGLMCIVRAIWKWVND